MVNRKIFDDGLEEIENAFDGFLMTKTKADIWYKYCKDLTDNKFLYRIANCIKGCRKIPALADILDWRNYYVNEKEEADIRAKKDEIKNEAIKKMEMKFRKETDYSTIPEEAKKIMAKINPKYRYKLKRSVIDNE
jgi:hypothetical protein